MILAVESTNDLPSFEDTSNIIQFVFKMPRHLGKAMTTTPQTGSRRTLILVSSGAAVDSAVSIQ